MNIDIEARVQKARDLFAEGYNCAQAVFMVYNDLFEIDDRLAATITAPLGGGLGRMREVCGSVLGMSLLAGQIRPAFDPSDKEAKARNYALVQEMAEVFRRENGAIVCRELLGLSNTKQGEEQPLAGVTTKYRRKPCVEYVADAARIVGERLEKNEQARKSIKKQH